MKKIYHITSNKDWERAKNQGSYTFCSLQSEGFIHCSTPSQFLEVANRIFSGQKDLVLLEIDEDKVTSKICYENLEGGSENYPHIYGPLSLSAVSNVYNFPCDTKGDFSSPF